MHFFKKGLLVALLASLAIANEGKAQVSADFTYSFVNDSCGDGVAVAFSNQSSGANSYRWYFEETSSSTSTSTLETPTFNFSYSGQRTVVLEAMTSNDTAVVAKTIDIDERVDTIIQLMPQSPVCTGDTVEFGGDFKAEAVKKWVFDGDSTSTRPRPKKVYHNPGTYNVKAILANNCNVDTATKTFEVKNDAQPEINAVNAYPENACVGRMIRFGRNMDLAYLDQVIWQFGDGDTSSLLAPKHVYKDTGIYTVALMGSNGCSWDTATTQVTIDQQGKLTSMSFLLNAPEKMCPGDSANFLINPAEKVLAFKWDFGDGNQSTLKKPRHAYSKPDTYNVKLTGYGYCGDSVVKTQDVIVTDSASIGNGFNWYPREICEGASVEFNAYDFRGSENASFSWDFGDGNTGKGMEPKNVYSDTGEYEVTLTVTSSCEGKYKRTQTLEVGKDHPIQRIFPDVTPNRPQCTGADFTFSYNDTNEVRNVKWFFGDGNTSTQKGEVSHSYSDTGRYTALLKAENYCGDRVFKSEQVTVSNDTKRDPDLSFGAPDFCPGIQVDFYSDPGYDGYLWKFGDGDTSHLRRPKHTYDTSGTFQVELMVEGPCGKDTATRNLTLHQSSQPDFDFKIACQGDSTYFTDRSSPKPLNWSWNFGNGKVGFEQNPAIKYDSAGRYPVTLTVKSMGCRLTRTREVEVAQSLDASFADSSDSLTVHFTETSSRADSFFWTFGDSTNSSQANPVKQYDSTGSYKVCLTVFDSCDQDSTCRTISFHSTSLTSTTRKNKLVLYPNPAEDELQILLKGSDEAIANLQMVNAKGQEVEINADLRKGTQGNNSLNIEQLKTGIYFLKIMTRDGAQYTRKFVVK